MRVGVAWFALLALALPGFASVRRLCCGPGLTKSSDCCAAAMKMPEMNSSQMESMLGGGPATADHWVAVTATRCVPVPDSEIAEFLVRNEWTFDGSLLLTRDSPSALAWNWGLDLRSSETTAVLLVEGRPPRIPLSDPFPVVLRI